MPEPDPFHANLQRGALLLGQNRPREALPFIQAAIAANPNAPQGYAELARCWIEIPADRAKSIPAINRAIGLAPNVSFYYGRKGWYLVCLLRFREALATAQAGLAINPTCPQSLNALANAYTKLGQWKKAEAACLRILALDPNDGPGLNLLAQALRHQGRWKETRETVARLLAQMPNNSFGHANAGYAALAAGDHLRANEHFLESLRMDPHFDLARRGLIQSLRARIWLIRFNLRISSFLRRLPTARDFFRLSAIAIGIFVALAGTSAIANFVHSGAGTVFLGMLLMIFLLSFFPLLLYVYLSGIVAVLGNFLLMFDPLGRHALTRREKVRSCIPALFFTIAMIMLISASYWIVAFTSIGLLFLLALSIQYPLLKDRWQRRREKQLAD